MRKSWVVIILFSLAGCYNEVEDCLDPQATNFNPEADQACCCTYPDLRLDVLYTYDTLEFFERGMYAHSIHDSVVVLDFGIVFRKFSVSSGMTTYGITDSTRFWTGSDVDSSRQYLTDDLILFGDRFNYTIGELIPALTFERLSFVTGLDSDYNDVRPASLNNHPLATLSDRGYWTEGEGFTDAFLQVAVGEDLQDTIRWSSGVEGFRTDGILTGVFEKVVGADLEVEIEFDMKCLIDDVDFLAPENEIGQALLLNFQHENCLKIR